MQKPWQALLPPYATGGGYTARHLRHHGQAVKTSPTTCWGKLSERDTQLQAYTHGGMGTVLIRPPFPRRSAMTHLSSRCWMCSNVTAATSLRRKPPPTNTARIAASRLPLVVEPSGARSNCSDWGPPSHCPSR